ncbi:hypothetical protein, partial [Lishizhenia sp.]|uniref:hypothetical protein n=1 Tax=Lishizhenia sp. TaxID=2497594 RepID=UPI00299E32B8
MKTLPLIVLLFTFSVFLYGQKEEAVFSSRISPNQSFNTQGYKSAMRHVKQMKDNQALQKSDLDQSWDLIGGLNLGGSVNELYSSRLGSDTIYIGSANGGVFRSENGGVSWQPLFDDQVFLSVSTIQSLPSNDSVLFVGTGDVNFSDPSYVGDGVYKSTDYGNTWVNLGLNDVGVVAELSVNPSNENEIIAACLGSPFEKNNKRGIYRSTDGGITWQQKLLVSDSSGVVDISRSKQDPNILYAANYNRMLQFGKRVHTGVDTKLYKSIDGGDTWQLVNLNLPYTINGRIGVEIAPSNDDYVYVVVAQNNGAGLLLLASFDGGQSWQIRKNDALFFNAYGYDFYNFQPWELTSVYVDPLNEEHVVMPGLEIWSSTDAGLTWEKKSEWFRENSTSHIHDVLFDGNSSFKVASIHGVFENSGVEWLPLGYLPITQYYDVTPLSDYPNFYMGAAQHIGIVYGDELNNQNWSRDPYFPGHTAYKVFANDTLSYVYSTGSKLKSKTVDLFEFPNNLAIHTNPAVHYINGSGRLLFGSDRLNVVSNLPNTFYSILSNDLTNNLGGQNTFHSLSEVEIGLYSNNVVYTGSTDGKIFESSNIQNGPASFVDLTPGSPLPQKYVTDIKLSYENLNVVYASFNGYFNSDSASYLFRKTANSNTWIDISGDLPPIGINSICIANGTSDSVIFVGTDAGVFITQNTGLNWTYLGTDMPVIAVMDVEIDYENEKLIAGTFGRSMYSYDISFLNLVTPPLSTVEKITNELTLYPNPAQDMLFVLGVENQSYQV